MLNLSCIFSREANNSRLYLGVDSSTIWIHTGTVCVPFAFKVMVTFLWIQNICQFLLCLHDYQRLFQIIYPKTQPLKKPITYCAIPNGALEELKAHSLLHERKDTMISVPSQKLKDLSPENKWWNDREKKQRRKADAVRQMSQELQLIFASNRCHFWLVSSFIPSTYLRSLLPSFICNNSLCEKYFSSLTVRIGFLYLLTQAQTAAAASPLVLQGCRWKKKHTGQI